LIERFNDAVWNQGNLDVIDEVIGPEFIWHSAPPGIPPTRDGLRMMIAGFRAAFSDAVSKVDEQIAEGDGVAWRWTFEGTHTGELMGIPGTGTRVTFAGVSIDRFGGGRSVERGDLYCGDVSSQTMRGTEGEIGRRRLVPFEAVA